MRTTLDIDDDVLEAANELAKAEGKTAGQVLSELARKALTTPDVPATGFADPGAESDLGGWPTFPHRGGRIVTLEVVERIQDELDAEDAVPQDFSLETRSPPPPDHAGRRQREPPR
jgi:hypothetical protein